MNKREQKVQEFETAFAKYIGVKYAVAVANSTAALHAALYAAGISHKDEVILSPLAHPEVAHAVRYLDGIPIYTDIDPKTGCLDPEAVRWRISANTKAIIATHYAGFPCDVEALAKVIEEKEIVIIEDASRALGGICQGKKIGTLSSLTIFDFSHPQGVYTELGGMVVTDSAEYASWLRLFRDTGMMYNHEELVKEEGPWHFEAQEIGFNYRLTSMQAGMGLEQLAKAEHKLARRKQIAAQYHTALSSLEEIELLQVPSQCEPAWYTFPILLHEKLMEKRKELVEELLRQGIDVDVQFYPIYLHPIYLWQGHPDICTIEGPLCPKAEEFYQRVINLSTYCRELTEDEIAKVINVLVAILKK
ncbi:aminotransferase class I/II-fold pyridoxal phosphate-dependent enzyme [Desulforamulus aeronauticus]|uniref:dTDP-4-amino-4,6-dideoxygalactose transaminase n=1 Tax=Desulforamulus aeronauticus DSM 10349 TaxID=1121421 RepID=A0A1M6RD14_9FIRM|nr:aminotransferase class I/II-fold pyridoxal phosphate-dependent enzyme [Desulforamulus aeronauticus]SHK30342.1 dTDP-4-amino-4,6-dideoxygalactose transaminase [Desulforamulus aeronauticus DSM 10349]